MKQKSGKVQQNYYGPSGAKPAAISNTNNNMNNMNNDFGVVGQTALKNPGRKQTVAPAQQAYKIDR